MIGLTLDKLPPLPQSARLARLAPCVWRHEDVRALWVGGSLAAGTADEYSDVDLRVAVRPEALEVWKTPDFPAIFEGEYVGGNRFAFGDDAFLHHLAMSSGDIFDFWVQSTDRDPAPEQIVILGCRDINYQQRLKNVLPAPPMEFPQADPTIIRQLVVDFWINSLKHRKVLHRGLDLLTLTGLALERSLLQRLWHVQATGRDSGAVGLTIHTLTQIARALEPSLDHRRWHLLGAPLTTRGEITQAIADHRDEVARVGRALAETLGFGYPALLEENIHRNWSHGGR